MKKILLLLTSCLIISQAVIASNSQNSWHDNKYSMFIHFGLYTVYGGVYEGKPVTRG